MKPRPLLKLPDVLLSWLGLYLAQRPRVQCVVFIYEHGLGIMVSRRVEQTPGGRIQHVRLRAPFADMPTVMSQVMLGWICKHGKFEAMSVGYYWHLELWRSGRVSVQHNERHIPRAGFWRRARPRKGEV